MQFFNLLRISVLVGFREAASPASWPVVGRSVAQVLRQVLHTGSGAIGRRIYAIFVLSADKKRSIAR